MFRRFKTFFTGMWAGVIIIVILFAWLQSHPTSSTSKFLNYKNYFLPAKQDETITIQMIKNDQNNQGGVILIEDEVTLGELMTLMAENPDCEIELDQESAKLVIKESGPCATGKRAIKLGVAGDYLGVYRKTFDGEEILERVTQIQVNELPMEWQALLLEGKLVFDDEVSLLEALDSLDEYQIR